MLIDLVWPVNVPAAGCESCPSLYENKYKDSKLGKPLTFLVIPKTNNRSRRCDQNRGLKLELRIEGIN